MKTMAALFGFGMFVLAGCSGGDGTGSSTDELAKVCATGTTVQGVDVSEFQGAIDWHAVHASGRVFGIARVADGVQHVDPTFGANYAAMKAEGMVRGSYQFFRASEDPIAQADLVLNAIGALGPGDLPPMLDVEVTDGQSNATIDAKIESWISHIEAKTGKKPLVYTGPYFWQQIGSPANLGASLVVADWTQGCPLVAPTWGSWTFWQYADNGHVSGIGPLVDLDVFDGDESQLRALTGGSSAPSDLPSPSDYVGIASSADGGGYWIVIGDGGVFTFGDAAFHGSAEPFHLAMPAVGIAATHDGGGYWVVAADGGAFAFGDAPFLGSMGGKTLNGHVVGIAGTSSGYWMTAVDGGLFGFGEAFYGSMGGKPLNAPVVGIAATPSGHGYWLVASDGGMFSFGDAQFYGSMGGKALNAPVTGIAARPQGDGYWMIAKDGGVFTFGAAGFHGRP
jgi:GH25 family lysozyme M1 (1,4-beta-N-acetylmuramidase)